MPFWRNIYPMTKEQALAKVKELGLEEIYNALTEEVEDKSVIAHLDKEVEEFHYSQYEA